jgi:hypothetical protein
MSKRFRVGDLVHANYFVCGHPVGLSGDTHCRIARLARPGRALLRRDDGRRGEWWVDTQDISFVGK